MGLLPLALGVGDGSEFLQPMGIVIFSGLSPRHAADPVYHSVLLHPAAWGAR
ncbi:MAG: efflux RND transporter permease subunit [Leptolyngbyaceae cyanobacterium]